MSKTEVAPELCTVAAFAEMCGVTYDEAAQWAEDGTIPSLDMGTFRMVNLARFRADLLKGKNTFDAGDYSHE
ncbi:TPA: hypothetical protein SL434_003785 [Pseudomonas aeruginosa]|uniref:hypothetical protein n=1 Tax=Pseudomonas aeruginosa TaxID=287 RepID=UPI000B8AA88C|nr:hypothetical protein [Pseudomonas aeruginosa]MBI8216054.1 hypothetical protein [Pseudomonas aeruginosa]OXR64277.1 hypothetical protein IPC1578_05185 [Pseudomonas aeruginosa]POO67012.1 hypothetical protein C3F46_08500 [Pseudomonas aeruginosa]HEJ3681546.1 hypothetical protein [Pseudomonas aeruginosa]HEK2190241.1 hypothetical protein [Pseudomonas aeruginosa]